MSHDRTFLDNVVTQVIAFEGDGLWREYVGGYSDWERYRPDAVAGSNKLATKSNSKPDVVPDPKAAF